MGLFGITTRGTPASLGSVSQQSVAQPGPTPSTAVMGPSARAATTSTPLITARTVSPLVISPSIAGSLTLPPTTRFVPPLITLKPKSYDQDSLRVSQFTIENNQFKAVEKNGISIFRPEIISMMNFLPIDGVGKEGSFNKKETPDQLLKSQFQAIEIRGLTVQKLMADVRSQREFRVQLDTIRNKFVSGLNTSRTALKYFGSLLDKIDVVKTSLDPKQIPNSAYDTANYLPLPDFFERKMQYSKAKFGNFSDTKVINQLISDLKSMLEGYSLSLFDLVDPDRNSDVSPITIDKTYTQTNGFTFTPSSVRSETVARNAFKSDFFNQFLNSLPSNPDDRIKLLVHFLSKELRVSKEMGKPQVATILAQKYQQPDNSNPFDNVVGVVGDTIFNQPLGPNSLASLSLISLNENNLVLPFESIYVDSEDERKVFVPGSTYFVDSILTTNKTTGFNVQPFISFVNDFNDTTSDAKNIIQTLLELDQDSSLSPSSVYDIFLSAVAESTSGLISSSGINKSQAMATAVFKLANSDTLLKNMLFEYCLLLGMSSVSNVDQKNIFEKLNIELGDVHNLQFISKSTLGSSGGPSIGQAYLRPFIEEIAGKIENQVFSLVSTLNPSLLSKDFAKSIPSLTATSLSSNISGQTRTLSSVGVNTGIIATNKITINFPNGYVYSFRRGEIKESLLNNVTSVGPSSTNFCKEFVDIAVKLDQNASISSNPVYLLSDGSGRTRQNYYSTSTLLLFVFEAISSFVSRYTFANFNKGNSLIESGVTINTELSEGIYNTIKDVLSTRAIQMFDKISIENKPSGLTVQNQITSNPGFRAPFSLFNVDLSKQTVRTPNVSSPTTNPSILPSVFSPSTQIVAKNAVLPNITSIINTPAFGFGRVFSNTTPNITSIRLSLEIIDFKKTIVSNRTKLADEDKTIKNILHILSIVNKRLVAAKEVVIHTFTKASIDTFLGSTNLPFVSLDLLRNPSQIMVSDWLLDYYHDNLSDATRDDTPTDTGFLITDRIPLVNMNAMFSLLKQAKFAHKNQADFNTKILTVGIPAGFSQNLSDRVERSAINEINFKDKQFDVVSVNVYKRDARYDDLVFKPQKFIFDLSMFPIKNFLPASLNSRTISFEDVIRNAVLRDYESLDHKKNVKLQDVLGNVKYSFLSSDQKKNMFENHIISELLELYIYLISGIEMNEEIFSGNEFTRSDLQDKSVLSLVIAYLKTVKGKDIPNQPISDLLSNPNLDQETKDTLRLLSYGNLIFQGDFIKSKILDPKLFDRVFHVPVNVDQFEIDVEATLSTEAGKKAYRKNSTQNMIYDVGGKKYLLPRSRNDLIFEDHFIVVETNLTGGS